jgi:hypothetical protein
MGTAYYGNPQMPKIKLFAVAAAMTATGFGPWAASTTNAGGAPPVGQRIEPMLMKATQFPHHVATTIRRL